MTKKTIRLYKSLNIFLIFLFVIIFSFPLVLALNYPTFSFPKFNEEFEINISSINETSIYYKPLIDSTYQSKRFNDTLILDSEIERQEVYEFYFGNETQTHPKGSLNFMFSDGINSFNETAKRFLLNSSRFSSCNPADNDTICGYENIQALRGLSFMKGYHVTNNETLLNYSKELFESNYVRESNLDRHETCCPTVNDFHCGGLTLGPTIGRVEGSEKQGMLIYSLWKSYQISGDSYLKELAINYTKGSAQDCDVWGSGEWDGIQKANFTCENIAGQGSMALGYWKAYEMTNNLTYFNIAENLTEKAYEMDNSSEWTAFALWRAYSMTGEKDYATKAKNVSEKILDKCCNGGCDAETHAINTLAMSEAYLNTNNYDYVKSVWNNLNIEMDDLCDECDEGFECDTSYEQALQSIASFRAFEVVPFKRFFEPSIDNQLVPGEEINISVKFLGDISSPKIHVKRANSQSWDEYEINQTTGKVTIPGLSDGFYNYYFIDKGNNRFPSNGSFNFLVSMQHGEFSETAKNLLTNPLLYCEPYSQDADYSCRLENMQAWMALSAGEYYEWNNSEQEEFLEVARNLALNEIDDTLGSPFPEQKRFASCEHYYFDTNKRGNFSCRYWNDAPFFYPRSVSGSKKQASLILAYISLYSITGDGAFLSIAQDYLNNHPEECNLWEGDFNCSSQEDENKVRDQALLIEAYLEAYKVLGNEDYLSIAKNLADYAGDNYDEGLVYNEPTMAMGFWRLYSYTQKEAYKTIAENITEETYEMCVEESCTVDDHMYNIYSFWKSSLYAGSIEINEYAYAKTIQRPQLSHPDDCDPNAPEDRYNCRWPDQQGIYANSYLLGEKYFLPANISYEIGLSVNQSKVNYNNKIRAICNVTNTDDFNANNIWIRLGTDFNITDYNTTSENYDLGENMDRINVDNLGSNETISFEWVMNATYGGSNPLMCEVGTYSNKSMVNVTNIGNIYNKNYNDSIYLPVSSNHSEFYSIENPKFFPLENVTLTLDKPGTVDLKKSTVFYNDGIEKKQLNFTNNTLNVDEFGGMHNITLNLTFCSQNITSDQMVFNITSKWGANSSFKQNFSTFDFNISFDKPEIVPFKKNFNLTLNITNKALVNLSSLSMELEKSPHFNLTYHNFNHSNITELNSTHLILDSFFSNETVSLLWQGFSNFKEDIDLLFRIDSEPVHREFVNISGDVFDFTYDDELTVEPNKVFNYKLYLENLADYALNNVSFNFSVDTSRKDSSFIENVSYFEKMNISYNVSESEDKISDGSTTQGQEAEPAEITIDTSGWSIDEADLMDIVITSDEDGIADIELLQLDVSSDTTVENLRDTINDQPLSGYLDVTVDGDNLVFTRDTSVDEEDLTLATLDLIESEIKYIKKYIKTDDFLTLYKKNISQVKFKNNLSNTTDKNITPRYNRILSLGNISTSTKNASTGKYLINWTMKSGEEGIDEIDIKILNHEGINYSLNPKIIVEKKRDPTSPSRDTSTRPPSSQPPPSEPEKENLFWHYEHLYTFDILFEKEKELENYFKLENRTIDFNKTLEQKECLNVTRLLNVSSNESQLNISNICNSSIENVYFYERIIRESISNLTIPERETFRNGTLFYISQLETNETFYLNYTLSNFTLEEIQKNYANFSVHMKKDKELVKEEPEKTFFFWNYKNLSIFRDPIQYDAGLRDLLGFEKKNISFSKTINKSSCLVVNRTYNAFTNVTSLNITNICKLEIKDLYIYENLSAELISNLSYENYVNLSNGILFNISSLAHNETTSINYTVLNLTVEEIKSSYDDFFIHLITKDEKIVEEEELTETLLGRFFSSFGGIFEHLTNAYDTSVSFIFEKIKDFPFDTRFLILMGIIFLIALLLLIRIFIYLPTFSKIERFINAKYIFLKKTLKAYFPSKKRKDEELDEDEESEGLEFQYPYLLTRTFYFSLIYEKIRINIKNSIPRFLKKLTFKRAYKAKVSYDHIDKLEKIYEEFLKILNSKDIEKHKLEELKNKILKVETESLTREEKKIAKLLDKSIYLALDKQKGREVNPKKAFKKMSGTDDRGEKIEEASTDKLTNVYFMLAKIELFTQEETQKIKDYIEEIINEFYRIEPSYLDEKERELYGIINDYLKYLGGKYGNQKI